MSASYKIRQHIPGYVEADPKDATVSSVEELLAVPWVKNWERHDRESQFHRWSASKDPRDKWWQLIAELRGGAEWWVVAHVPIEMDSGKLPRWDSVRAMELKAGYEANKAAELTSRISDAISDSKK